MAPKQIMAEQLTPGRTIALTGKVGFSRIASTIKGEELARSIARQTQRGRQYPMKAEHTSLSLYDVQVYATDVDANGNPKFTTEEAFVAERCFDSTKAERPGKNYTIENRGNRLPVVLKQAPDGQEGYVQEPVLQGELARDTEVTVILNVYKSSHPKPGLGLEAIVVNAQEVPYYSASSINTETLGALGITLNGPVQATVGTDGAPTYDSDSDDNQSGPDAGMPGPLTPSPAAQAQAAQPQQQYQAPPAQQPQAPVQQQMPQQAPMQPQTPQPQQVQYQQQPQQAPAQAPQQMPQQPQQQMQPQQPTQQPQQQYQPPANQQQDGSAFDLAPHNQQQQPGISFG